MSRDAAQRIVEGLIAGFGERGDAGPILALLGAGPARARAELAIQAFARGVTAARQQKQVAALIDALADAPPIAWEGVGLVAALADRFSSCLDAHPRRAPWLWIGQGWADALLGAPVEPLVSVSGVDLEQAREDLRLDGRGFWLGLRHGARLSEARDRPTSPTAAACFDQGVGRSLYFSLGGDPRGLARAIQARGRARQAALWSGVGVAAWVTGGLGPRRDGELEALAAVGGDDLRRGLALGQALIES